jgi:hypothetical protein
MENTTIGTVGFQETDSTPCTCGNTEMMFLHDENQYEPACWECYEREHDEWLKSQPKQRSVEVINDLPF